MANHARVVLLMAAGESGTEVARLTGYTAVQISRIGSRSSGSAGTSGRAAALPVRLRANGARAPRLPRR